MVANIVSPISIECGFTGRNLSAVRKLRNNIYHRDPHWIPSLSSQFKRQYATDHPYFKRGCAELFVIWLGNTPVATALAFFDAASAGACGGCSAYFAAFDCIDDAAIADRLIGALETWADRQGATELIGPMSPRLSDARGVLIDGNSPAVFGMAYTAPYYDTLLTQAGFEKATDLFEFIVEKQPSYPRLDKIVELAQRRFPSIRLRPFDFDRLPEEIAVMAQIYDAAWRRNWGFMPLDTEDFTRSAMALRPILGPSGAMFVEIDGRPVGFQMVVPDINSAVKSINGRLFPFGWLRLKRLVAKERTFRAMFIGVLPQFRKCGIEALLIQAGLSTGAQRYHVGWVLESNFSWKAEIEALTGGQAATKKYRIYRRPCKEKAIANAA